MQIGVLVQMRKDICATFKKISDLGFSSCQVACWNPELFTDEMAEEIKKSSQEYKVNISTFWCGWTGPAVWDFYEGPLTLGLVPKSYRMGRMEEIMRGSDFAKKAGIENLATHVGFLPETPNTEEYRSLLCDIRKVADYCKRNGQYFLFETGQETPVTLRRTIEDVGTDNLGINLDPANLILYGKANPVDALDVFGEYVRDVHAKDGLYPTNGKNLGRETPIGEGKVDFPRFMKRLKEIGYNGPVTIEREIEGDKQTEDIVRAKEILEKLI